MEKKLVQQIIEWDLVNWSKALPFWEEQLKEPSKGKKALELGGRNGGISLWLGLKGYEVICSDLENPKESASKLHAQYDHLNIRYEAINATDIPYENEFDLVIFKSILGGISRNGQDELKKAVIDQAHKALKEGGQLLFAENMEASIIHRFFRKNFVKWGGEWNYLKAAEIDSLFSEFSSLKYRSAGFLGAFGRSEGQRQFLGKIDNTIEKALSKKQHYLVFGVAEK